MSGVSGSDPLIGVAAAVTEAQVEATVQDDAKCIAGSSGRNSCAVEFDELEMAQEVLETVVADYREACP